MTTKFPCYIQFSDSGNFCRIVHKSGMTIAELVCDVNFLLRAAAAHDRLGLQEIPRPTKPYQAFTSEVRSQSEIREEIYELNKMLENSEDLEHYIPEKKKPF